MRLTAAALQTVKLIRPDVMKALGCSESNVNTHIQKNKLNGPLTTAGVMELIRMASDLPDDKLLERIPAEMKIADP